MKVTAKVNEQSSMSPPGDTRGGRAEETQSREECGPSSSTKGRVANCKKISFACIFLLHAETAPVFFTCELASPQRESEDR